MNSASRWNPLGIRSEPDELEACTKDVSHRLFLLWESLARGFKATEIPAVIFSLATNESLPAHSRNTSLLVITCCSITCFEMLFVLTVSLFAVVK
ncbi:hypothetical protein COLO4_37661 [Corchorus olitorius]|uniref:Uncharacterized protein n=1 Tax=Corchorus olitorius TaxID=93759 RepID=A0A1R3G043_9ROSI|nr:hypothetical protein COLO4_37661 [Corchorus olitorius]